MFNTIEEGWKGIKILETSKVSVEKLLGQPKVDNDGFYKYETDDAFIRIEYTESPCKEYKFSRGKYNVAKDIVLEYTVNLKKNIELSEFEFKRENYHKDTSGDLSNFVDYQNFDDGIIITVQIQENGKKGVEDVEYVRNIVFTPIMMTDNPHKCSSISKILVSRLAKVL